RIFEPYFTTKATGTGLGLAIVRKIMLDHGGDVRLMNRRDGKPGAEAWIDIPAMSEKQLALIDLSDDDADSPDNGQDTDEDVADAHESAAIALAELADQMTDIDASEGVASDVEEPAEPEPTH